MWTICSGSPGEPPWRMLCKDFAQFQRCFLLEDVTDLETLVDCKSLGERDPVECGFSARRCSGAAVTDDMEQCLPE